MTDGTGEIGQSVVDALAGAKERLGETLDCEHEWNTEAVPELGGAIRQVCAKCRLAQYVPISQGVPMTDTPETREAIPTTTQGD